VARDELDRALPEIERALQIDPELALPYKLRSIIHKRKKDLPAAITDMRRYHELETDAHLRVWAEEEIAEMEKETRRGLKGLAQLFKR